MSTSATASITRRERQPYDVNPTLYYITKAIIGLIMHVLFRYRAHGRENIPATGAAILAVNHLHYIDPGAVAPPVRRNVRSRENENTIRHPDCSGRLASAGFGRVAHANC